MTTTKQSRARWSRCAISIKAVTIFYKGRLQLGQGHQRRAACRIQPKPTTQHSTPSAEAGKDTVNILAPFGGKGTMLRDWPFNPHDNSVGTITLAPKLGNRGIRGQVASIKKGSPQTPFYTLPPSDALTSCRVTSVDTEASLGTVPRGTAIIPWQLGRSSPPP